MAQGSEVEYDPHNGITVLNDTEVSTEDLVKSHALQDVLSRQAPEHAALRRWSLNAQGASRGKGTVFHRDKYVTPDNIFDQFKMAADAARSDDIVSNVLETTEQLAFKRVAIEVDDEHEQYVWNKVLDDMNFSERLREAWREQMVVSQCYPAVLWGTKTISVKKSKKVYRNLKVPIAVTFLDPLKVLPVGNFMFGQEKLVYIADRGEVQELEMLAGNNTSDLVVSSLLKEAYEPSFSEKQLLQSLTGHTDFTGRLFLLNPENVWRITATRPSYKRFADVRMVSVFELLDLKNLLREMDRAAILGTTNAIILVKRGDDKVGAKPAELAQLQNKFTTSSRIPLIVSDHRIEIEIITPSTDKTLSPERYNGLDSRITSRMYQVLSTGNYSSGTATDDSMKLMRVVAASMEARRDQIRDSFMNHMFQRMYDNNKMLKEEPQMHYYPRRIALDFDPTIADFLQALRDRGDLSRATILAELDIDEAEEAKKREIEAVKYDKVFTPVNVPYDKPGEGGTPAGPGATPKAAGKSGGGKKNGGGRNPAGTRPNSQADLEDDTELVDDTDVTDDEV